MAPDRSIRLSCPGCEKRNLRSYVGARNHFIKAQHLLECFVCEKTFTDELGVIQHYQKCIQSNGVCSDIPSSSAPSTRVPSTSVPSTSAVIKSVLRSRGVQTDTLEQTLNVPEQGFETLYSPLLQSLLAYMPATSLQALYTQGKKPRI